VAFSFWGGRRERKKKRKKKKKNNGFEFTQETNFYCVLLDKILYKNEMISNDGRMLFKILVSLIDQDLIFVQL